MKLTHSYVASVVLQSIVLIFSAGSSGATPVTPLLDATWDGEVATGNANEGFNPTYTSSPGTYSSQFSSSLGLGTSEATLNAFSLPNPSLTASITLSTPGPYSQSHAQAFMRLDYYLTVNGTGTGLVPVDVSSFGNVSMSAVPAGDIFSAAFATFQLTGPNPSAPALAAQVLSLNDPGGGAANPGGTSNYSLAQLVSLQVGTTYSIDMYVNVAAEIGGAATSQVVTAFIDPVFTIDPGFADANSFSLQFSDGIGDSPDAPATTPLPSTWLMLLSGIVGLSLFASRGKKKNAVALAAG